MNKIIRKIVYTDLFKFINKIILSFFFESRYLSGRYFDEERYGYVWAWKCIFRSFILRRRGIRWPIHELCRLPNGYNIFFDNSSMHIFQQPGCYFQNYHGKIFIGKDVYIAQNVGLITENHDPDNPKLHLPAKDIRIGDGSWIGMNSVVLPGVVLGPNTTVGAGSVVTHSFSGDCIVAGNPARVIKTKEKTCEVSSIK